MAKVFMSLYGLFALVVSIGGIAWMFIQPPHSTRVDRDGVPHFTPEVLNPATGKGVTVNDLIRHFRGD